MTREQIQAEADKRYPSLHNHITTEEEIQDSLNEGFVEGAEWMQEQYENNRLSHCDNMTKEEAEREMEFVTSFIIQNDRIPTFSDCIEITRKEMIDKTFRWLIRQYGDMAVATQYFNSMKGE